MTDKKHSGVKPLSVAIIAFDSLIYGDDLVNIQVHLPEPQAPFTGMWFNLPAMLSSSSCAGKTTACITTTRQVAEEMYRELGEFLGSSKKTS